MISRLVLETIRTTERKLTQLAVETAIGNSLQVGRKEARSVIRNLVAAGELAYTYHFGCSFLELSFNRPVRVCTRVVLKPPVCRFAAREGDIVISLAPGSAFGTGEHPTTRLALQGMEYLLSGDEGAGIANARNRETALDVGTGSGILVIAAVGFGLKHGVGIDIDPCALAEASENVRLNGLQTRIAIRAQAVEKLPGSFSMVTANLRTPSLARLASCLAGLTEAGGRLVLSGIRTAEMASLEKIYAAEGFLCQWRREESGWGGMAFCKIGEAKELPGPNDQGAPA